MQQKLVWEEMGLHIHWEECEQLQRECEEEQHACVDECQWCENRCYENRRHHEEELLESRMKDIQQQQQMTMMQFGMTAMMAYFGLKPPIPDDKLH